MKILLVEDELILLERLGKHLTKKGHTVQETMDGQIGWETFVENPKAFDLILSDIKMPTMDGLELLNRIRLEDYQIPFIFMTGHGELQLSIEALKLGVFDFILKPFRFQILDDTLAKLESMQVSQEQMGEILPLVNLKAEIRIGSESRLIMALVQYLKNLFEPFCRFYQVDAYHLSLCLTESLLNAVDHGNLEVSSSKREGDDSYQALIEEREALPEFSNRKVIVRYQLSSQRLEFEIEDQGRGFDWKNLPTHDPSELLVHGRGLLIIKTMMDEVSWNESGNCIRMVKHLQSSQENE